jgi:DNA/RNA-binding domain of Phe-tRNA-synthetase-like protein
MSVLNIAEGLVKREHLLSFQMGGKKMGGMGAQKVKKDFAEIEREAEMADQVRSKEAEETVTKKQPEKDEETVAASMRLAYQEIGAQQKKTVSPPCARAAGSSV